MKRSADDDFQRGLVALRAGRLNDAERLFKAVLRAQPLHLGALNLIGAALIQLKRFAEAESHLFQALGRHPISDATLYNYGIALKALNRPAEAVQRFSEALTINSSVPETWNNRGTALNDLKRYEEAIADFDKAITLNPRYAEAFSNEGKALTELERYDAALHAYEFALALKPDLAEAWVGRGKLLISVNRVDQASAAYDRALALKPDLAQAWLGRASIMLQLGHYDEAVDGYQSALGLDPDLHCAEGYRLFAKLNLCDWASLDDDVDRLLLRLREGRCVSAPFPLLTVPSTAADQLQCAECFMKDLPARQAVWRGEMYFHDRIHVAYLSADFRDHPVAHLTAGLFESHDRSRFEITGISIGPAQESRIRRRLKHAFESFVEAEDKTDIEIAHLIRDRQIDIAVDLMGHTLGSRLGILARRPAPIQVHHIGYAGTLGANHIDYILADPTVLPGEHLPFFAEQVVWLPDCYLASDDRRTISPRTPTRYESGLPEDGFVFCSFNTSYKISPMMFQLWMRLLQGTPNSVLWLSQTNSIAMANLRREAERCGINPQRLIFAPKVTDNADHLARQHLADLFLDTLPYNAHTTASDALWAGLPVLKCLGETFAGRVAASLLRAIGLPELITTSLDGYEALALKLANDPALLATIKSKLAQNRETHPLFNTAKFTRHIEAAYITMWERYQRGEPPAAFAVGEEDRVEQCRTPPPNANTANAQA